MVKDPFITVEYLLVLSKDFTLLESDCVSTLAFDIDGYLIFSI